MTHLLIDNLLASKKKPKIIFLSSIAHNFARGNIDFDDLELKRPGAFNGLKSYGLSKLANILTAIANILTAILIPSFAISTIIVLLNSPINWQH